MHNTKLLAIFSFLIISLGIGILLLVPSPISKPVPKATNSAFVAKVIDGDTIELESGQAVRLLGIDAPETKDPRKSVECFGKQASSETKKLLNRKSVILEKDITEKDKYRRLLRYVFLPLSSGQTLFVNDYLIREGFAKVLMIPPDVKYAEQFLEAQREAREEKRGLWGSC